MWNVILYNINFVWHNYAKCWYICKYFSLMADGIANFLILVVTDVIVTASCKPLRCYWQMFFAMWLTMATLIYG